MIKWFKQLDAILRGEATRMSLLKENDIQISIGGITFLIIVLGVIYGLCMGSFAVLRTGTEGINQMVASAVKFPLLFILTLIICFPSLYVFNALIGSNLSMYSALKLLVASIATIVTVAASLGPIVVFFSISTTSYPFIKLLNVGFCAVSGLLGLTFLLRTLHRLVLAQDPLYRDELTRAAALTTATTGDNNTTATANGTNSLAKPADLSPLDLIGNTTNQKAKTVFRIWTVVFALVGAQMSWILRPFIGSPDAPFEWFRARESNFFLDVLKAVGNLLNLH